MPRDRGPVRSSRCVCWDLRPWVRALKWDVMMRHWMICKVWALGLLALLASGAAAEPAKHGLMWHRSGLPAVFPLQVKTLGPQDYYVTLTDVETDEAVLAAYIEGGRFFRVLVPPGTFEVRFAFGNAWQSEEDLFGAGNSTTQYQMPRPLTFGVRNFNTKGGHLVDLRNLSPGQQAQVMPRDLLVCQGMRLVSGARGFDVHPFGIEPKFTSLEDWEARRRDGDYPRYEVRARFC